MAKIIHYRKKCIGCGICYELMPEVWRMSKKDGKATLLKAVVKKDVSILIINPTMISVAESVAEACPVKIIKVD
ncbi:MAG: ferredoxin [Chitinophagaceae bacterium]